MSASRLQSEPAACARLEHELSKLPAQLIAAGCALGDRQPSTPHDGAEPLDQPRLTDDQAVAVRRAGERGTPPIKADANGQRCLRQQFRGGVAEAALIKRPGGQGRRGAGRSRRTAGATEPAADAAPRVTVSRSASTSRSTSALWSRRRARSRPATSMPSDQRPVWVPLARQLE